MPIKRIGHKGAHHLAPGNTAASFDAALAHGVDMIEFDVMKHDGVLVLAHDPVDASERATMTLDEGLDHFATDAYNNTGLDVDMKHPGFERYLADALAARGLSERTLVTSMHPESLTKLRQHDPKLRLGLTVPRVGRDWTKSSRPIQILILIVLVYLRLVMPRRAVRALTDGGFEAIVAYQGVVSTRLVNAVARAGAELYVWTVDDAKKIARFERMGVTGVITNDPRLFDAVPNSA